MINCNYRSTQKFTAIQGGSVRYCNECYYWFLLNLTYFQSMKVLLVFALLLSTISCNNRAELSISEKTIDQLSKGKFKIPSINGFAMLFISTQQKNIAVTILMFYMIYIRSIILTGI